MTSLRAASWVYDVINVLIDALGVEATLLRRGDSSWRFYNEQLEHIRPLNAYLTRNAQHILRDFLLARPEVGTALMQHDDLRASLEAAATAAARASLAETDLRAKVEDARKRYLLRHPKDVPTGAFTAEKLADLVAEHLVNEVEALPANYTDAVFWKEHGLELSGVVSTPALQALRRARQALLSYDQGAIEWLKEYSYSLCQQFDIPAAPSAVTGYR
jgi:hypothetical protein